MMLLPLVFLLSLTIGAAFLWATGIRPSQNRWSITLLSSLGLCIGFAFGSVIYFAVSRFREPSAGVLFLIEFALVFGLVVIGSIASRQAFKIPVSAIRHPRSDRVWTTAVGFCSAAALISVLVYVVAHAVRYPNGGMDSVGFWYFRARMLFLSEDRWDAVFGMMGHFRPDHPVMLTTLVARCWTLMGMESREVYTLIALLATLGMTGVLYGALGTFRNALIANLGVILLFLPTSMAGNAGLLMSDILYAYILVCAFACFLAADYQPENRLRLHLLTGFFLGIATWMKNEGLVWNFAFQLALLGVGWWRGRLIANIKIGGLVLLACLPFLSAEIWFKSLVPFEEIDCLVPAFPPGGLMKVLDLNRDMEIVDRMLGGTIKFISWGLLAIPALLYLGGTRAKFREREAINVLGGVFFFAILGYGAAFVATPNPLEFQIGYSINRICVHFWPSVVMSLLMLSKIGDELADSRSDT
ncbi:MAG: hypothetical protein KC931_00525 [Candidatus Omnitrophica bacterium]|nr:hypothetical protein [Candidatus Omnitrophota bacterium]